MKRLILLFTLLPLFVYSQNSVRTEFASNKYVHYTTAATDTILNVKYFDGIVFNTSVAADSIFIRSSSDTLAIIVLGASRPVYPYYVHYGFRIDGVFNIIQKKTSDLTVIYRLGY